MVMETENKILKKVILIKKSCNKLKTFEKNKSSEKS